MQDEVSMAFFLLKAVVLITSYDFTIGRYVSGMDKHMNGSKCLNIDKMSDIV